MSNEQERRLDELLGAYALDAVSDEERREIEEYLTLDPRARAEVEEHREVATMLAWSGVSAPEGLWERIADELEEPAPPPTGDLAAVLSFDAQAPRRRRSSVLRAIAPWTVGAVAAALVAVIVVDATRDEGGRSDIAALAEAAREDRDSAVAQLVSADGAVAGEAVIDQDGHGYLIARSLPALSEDRTYQLWGVIEGEAISLGVLGAAPEVETFTAAGELTALVITNEVAGGVITDGNPEGAYVGSLG